MVDTTAWDCTKAFHCSRALNKKARLHIKAMRDKKSSQRMVNTLVKNNKRKPAAQLVR